MGHMVKYPDRRDGSTLFDFYGNIIPASGGGLLFTAKGDIPVGTGPGAGVMQAVGTNGQVLTADSTQVDGVKWATPGASGTSSVTAGDASLVISPTSGAVIAEAGTLDQIANLHHAAADWTNNSHKITSLAAPSATGDAVSQGHVLAPLETEFTAAGQLIAGTGTGTGELLSKGGPGTVLTVGGADPSGLEWVTPASPSGVTVVNTVFTAHAYTLVLGDANTEQVASDANTAATITVPTNASVAFAIGTIISITQTDTGKKSVAAAGGVTIESSVPGGFSSGVTGCRVQFSTIGLLKIATDTWVLSGDLQ